MDRDEAQNLCRTIIAEASDILASEGTHDADGVSYESRAINVMDMYDELCAKCAEIPTEVTNAYDDVLDWL